MAETNEAAKPQQIAGEPNEADIRELKRDAKRNNIKLAIAGKNAWAVTK